MKEVITCRHRHAVAILSITWSQGYSVLNSSARVVQSDVHLRWTIWLIQQIKNNDFDRIFCLLDRMTLRSWSIHISFAQSIMRQLDLWKIKLENNTIYRNNKCNLSNHFHQFFPRFVTSSFSPTKNSESTSIGNVHPIIPTDLFCLWKYFSFIWYIL